MPAKRFPRAVKAPTASAVRGLGIVLESFERVRLHPVHAKAEMSRIYSLDELADIKAAKAWALAARGSFPSLGKR